MQFYLSGGNRYVNDRMKATSNFFQKDIFLKTQVPVGCFKCFCLFVCFGVILFCFISSCGSIENRKSLDLVLSYQFVKKTQEQKLTVKRDNGRQGREREVDSGVTK